MRARHTGDPRLVRSHRFTAPASPQAVPELRTAVVEYAGEQAVSDPPLADLKVAVSEAVSNAVLHAYRDGGTGTVTVTVEIEPARNEVRIVVADDGMGLTPRADSPGLGLGLPLISTLAEQVDIRTPPDGQGTELSMTFRIPLADEPGAPG